MELIDELLSYSELQLMDVERIIGVEDKILASEVIGELIRKNFFESRFIITCESTNKQYIASTLREVCDSCRICGEAPNQDILSKTTVFFTKIV